jgi:hypothetical protein
MKGRKMNENNPMTNYLRFKSQIVKRLAAECGLHVDEHNLEVAVKELEFLLDQLDDELYHMELDVYELYHMELDVELDARANVR